VKKGQLIAELDKSDANNSIRQAEINLNNSKIKLQEDLKPLEYKDTLKSEADIAKQQSDLINSTNSLQNLSTERDNKIFDLNNQINSKNSDIESKQN
jgi:multidrug efflux pump subunit AcrA (membrane-fusion protein)